MRDCDLLQHSTLADPTTVTACTPTHHAAFQLSSVVLSAHSSHDANWCQNRVMDLYGAPTIAHTHSNECCMYYLTTAMMASGFGQTTTMPGKLTRRRQQQIQNRTVCRWVCVCVCDELGLAASQQDRTENKSHILRRRLCALLHRPNTARNHRPTSLNSMHDHGLSLRSTSCCAHAQIMCTSCIDVAHTHSIRRFCGALLGST